MSASRELLTELSRETSTTRRPRAVIIDWESGSKHERQDSSEKLIGISTNLTHDGPDGVEVARQLGFERVICRINGMNPGTPDEVESVIDQGGTDVLLPMWNTIEQVRALEDIVRGRARIGLMIETSGALDAARQLRVVAPSFAFIGLVDMAIDRGTSSIFTPIIDGTLEKVVADLGDTPFGFGGLTLPNKGEPIPSRLFVGEMLRLGARFSVMRRSFFRDVPVPDSGSAIEEINKAITRWDGRGIDDVERDHGDLLTLVRNLK